MRQVWCVAGGARGLGLGFLGRRFGVVHGSERLRREWVFGLVILEGVGRRAVVLV